MGIRMPADDQKHLANRLREEAQATRPEFSQELHQRICQAVQQDKTLPVRHPRAAPWRQRFLPLAVAAALLLGVSFTAWWFSRPAEQGPGPTEIAESVADPFDLAGETGRAAEQFGLLVDSALNQQQWGYLDHDVQLAARLFIEQLPLAEAGDEEFPTEPTTQSSNETAG